MLKGNLFVEYINIKKEKKICILNINLIHFTEFIQTLAFHLWQEDNEY